MPLINETLIEFRTMFAGTYAVLYFPKKLYNGNNICGFFCIYKKSFLILFLLIVPFTLLVFLHFRPRFSLIYEYSKIGDI